MLNLIRAKCNTLTIKIDKLGQVQIVAPLKMPLKEILDFVHKKEKWVIQKQKRINSVLELNKDILNYEKFLYLGETFTPVLTNINKIDLEADKILIPLKCKEKYLTAIIKWYKLRAISVIENRILYFSSIFNLQFSGIKLMNSKNRWGTCNEKCELTFNYRLIMLPPKVIDYVIIHELAHLIELNHSKKFWEAVKTMMPDFIKYKDILKNSSFILTLFR